MEQKTKVTAETGRHDLFITREFELPVELLFRAHIEPAFIEQWMSNPYATAKVLKFEGKKHGCYQFQSTDAQGKVVFRSNGVIHDLSPNRKMIRTFEMENGNFGVQLEVYEFESLSEETSKLTMHVIYESIEKRDQLLQMPFAPGISLAHNRLQEIFKTLK
jgi:uncharacterized protein YndB with AHSA1/START domain